MSERGEPRWELLPHDPAGFFELDGSFDRKTLKERYTDLVRRYKPEKHPSEFQRIRAAFEALDARLRYGQQEQSGQKAFGYQWPTDESTINPPEVRASSRDARPSHPQQTRREPDQELSLISRLEIEELSQLYEELERRESKSAYDYYALAVLSDLGQPNGRPGFLQWVLEGLKALPREPGLSALLYEMLSQNDFGDDNPQVLLAVSRLFPSDQFYYFTEALWHRFIKCGSVLRFESTLEHCEANLRDHRIGAKVAFYVRILRVALWRASDSWIERALAFLTGNPDQISGELEYEMELTLQLDRYRRFAHLFVDGSPPREKIHRSIREFCKFDEQEGAERLVRTQLELVTDSDALLSAFPFDEADHSPAYNALWWISHATDVRLGIDRPPPELNKMRNDTMRFMKEVDSLDDPNPWQLYRILKAAIEVAAVLLLAIILCAFITLIHPVVVNWLRLKPLTSATVLNAMLFEAVIVTVALYIAVIRKKTTIRWFARWPERIARRKYQRRWRYQVLRFLQKTQYPLEEVRDTIRAHVRQNPGVFGASTWLPDFMSSDFGLAFYALAHSYER